jgi:hypothetical protein
VLSARTNPFAAAVWRGQTACSSRSTPFRYGQQCRAAGRCSSRPPLVPGLAAPTPASCPAALRPASRADPAEGGRAALPGLRRCSALQRHAATAAPARPDGPHLPDSPLPTPARWPGLAMPLAGPARCAQTDAGPLSQDLPGSLGHVPASSSPSSRPDCKGITRQRRRYITSESVIEITGIIQGRKAVPRRLARGIREFRTRTAQPFPRWSRLTDWRGTSGKPAAFADRRPSQEFARLAMKAGQPAAIETAESARITSLPQPLGR